MEDFFMEEFIAKTKIMVCCHKQCSFPDDELYLPIQVGKARSQLDLGIQTDDKANGKDCRNISQLNNIYCEMTAMYWAWQNIRNVYQDIKYVGLCHYRRYFNVGTDILGTLGYPFKKIKTIIKMTLGIPLGLCIHNPSVKIKSFNDRRFVNSTYVLKRLVSKYDIIYTKPARVYNMNISLLFSVVGQQYIDILRDIIEKIYPAYEKAFNSVMKSNKLYSANMIILHVSHLDEYCSFIFGALKMHRDYVKEHNICLDPDNEIIYSRVSGYLAEILTSTYIKYMKRYVKCKALNKFFIEE